MHPCLSLSTLELSVSRFDQDLLTTTPHMHDGRQVSASFGPMVRNQDATSVRKSRRVALFLRPYMAMLALHGMLAFVLVPLPWRSFQSTRELYQAAPKNCGVNQAHSPTERSAWPFFAMASIAVVSSIASDVQDEPPSISRAGQDFTIHASRVENQHRDSATPKVHEPHIRSVEVYCGMLAADLLSIDC